MPRRGLGVTWYLKRLLRRGNRIFLGFVEPVPILHLYVRLVYRGYEEFESSLFRRLLLPGMVVLDIGAGWGHYSRIASGVVGKEGRVFAFEPDPIVFRALLRNLKGTENGNVFAFPFAVSDQSAWRELSLTGVIGGQSIHKSTDGHRKVRVRTVKADDFVLHRVDLVKIDVDGGELAVIRGMNRIANVNQSIIIIMEYWPPNLKSAGVEPSDLIRELKSKGFEIFEIDSKRHQLNRVSHDYFPRALESGTNLLCLRQAVLSQLGPGISKYVDSAQPPKVTNTVNSLQYHVVESIQGG